MIGRVVGIAIGMVGAIVTACSFIAGLAATGAISTLAWLVPECVGIALLLVGIHAWIDAR